MKTLATLLIILLSACSTQAHHVSLVPTSADQTFLSEPPAPIECDEDEVIEEPLIREDSPPVIMLDECTYRQVIANEARLKTVEAEAQITDEVRRSELQAVRETEEKVNKYIQSLQPGVADKIFGFETGVVLGAVLTTVLVYGINKAQE